MVPRTRLGSPARSGPQASPMRWPARSQPTMIAGARSVAIGQSVMTGWARPRLPLRWPAPASAPATFARDGLASREGARGGLIEITPGCGLLHGHRHISDFSPLIGSEDAHLPAREDGKLQGARCLIFVGTGNPTLVVPTQTEGARSICRSSELRGRSRSDSSWRKDRDVGAGTDGEGNRVKASSTPHRVTGDVVGSVHYGGPSNARLWGARTVARGQNPAGRSWTQYKPKCRYT
jgi:hypothetical protein